MAKIKNLNEQVQATNRIETLIATIKGAEKFINTPNPSNKINISFILPPKEFGDYSTNVETTMICDNKIIFNSMILDYMGTLIAEIDFLVGKYEIILEDKEKEILNRVKESICK